MTEYYLHAIAIGTGFLSAFLRSIQNKNVQSNMRVMSFATGWAMGVADAASIAIIANVGFIIGIFSGFGIGLGYVAGIVVHNALTAKQRKEAKRKKRERLEKRISKTIQKHNNHLDDGKEGN